MRLILRTHNDQGGGILKNSSAVVNSKNENLPTLHNSVNKQSPLTSHDVISYLSFQSFDNEAKRHPLLLNSKTDNSYFSSRDYTIRNEVIQRRKTSNFEENNSRQNASYLLDNFKNTKKKIKSVDLFAKGNIHSEKKEQIKNLRNESVIPKMLYFTETSTKHDFLVFAMKHIPRAQKTIRSIADQQSPPKSVNIHNGYFLFASICVPLIFAIIFGVWNMRRMKQKTLTKKSISKYKKIPGTYPGKAKRSKKSKENFKSKKLPDNDKNQDFVFDSLPFLQNEFNSCYFDSHCNVNNLDQISVRKCCCNGNGVKGLQDLPHIDLLTYNGYMHKSKKRISRYRKNSENNLLLLIDSDCDEKQESLKSQEFIPQKLSSNSNILLQFSDEELSIIPEHCEERRVRFQGVMNPADLNSSGYSTSSLSTVYCSNNDFLSNNIYDFEEGHFRSHPFLYKKKEGRFISMHDGPTMSDFCLVYDMDEYKKDEQIPQISNASFTSVSESLNTTEGTNESQVITNLMDETENDRNEMSKLKLLKTDDFNSSDNSIELEDVIVHE
ncbi:hypothetical protein NPIL_61411 [Nephila pilipes]|uniref:Uncharacterized protein n=1 Tax=Nephila pilipes TaxID=299642 RepID=A0A8X6TKT6_NEPPI|nr:hypothetical protein NPIL_61411 [Nephila pilipes]